MWCSGQPHRWIGAAGAAAVRKADGNPHPHISRDLDTSIGGNISGVDELDAHSF